MSQHFGRHVRLRTRAEFSAVQDRGRRVATTYLTVLGLSNARDCDRLGLIASRRLGGATRRNRAKRRVRELFRMEHPDQPKNAAGFDFVVIPKRESVDAPFPALQADFRSAMRRLRGTR